MPYLQLSPNQLKSMEPERDLSATGLFATKRRSRLND